MLRIAATALRDEINSLGFFERSAGLVRTVERLVQTGRGKSVKSVTEKYPVSCNLTDNECWEESTNKYLNLVPNSKKKGMFYFEQLQGMKLNTRLTKGGFTTYTGRVRLVMFYNIKELNLNDLQGADCSISFYMRMALNKVLRNRLGAKKISYTHSLFSQPIEIWAEEVAQLEGDYKLFEKYSYSEQMKPFSLFPFEFLANDYEVSLRYSDGCLNDIILGTAIDC